MNTRNCYCDGMTEDFRIKEGIQEGFCGICERCDAQGHTRHFPGAVPYTGSWCDSCYKKVGRSHIFKSILVLLVLLSIIGLVAYYFFFRN